MTQTTALHSDDERNCMERLNDSFAGATFIFTDCFVVPHRHHKSILFAPENKKRLQQHLFSI